MIQEIKHGTALRCDGCGAVYEVTPSTTGAMRHGFADYHSDCGKYGSLDAARAVMRKRARSALLAQSDHRKRSALDIAA